MTYPQRVAANLLPKSTAQSLPDAFEEWRFTGIVEDHEQATEVCLLCDKEQLRYHFLIRNHQTQHTLWIGSQCILKFRIAVYRGDRRVAPEQVERHLEQLTQQMRLASCLRALERLAAAEQNGILSTALAHYKQDGVLSPKQAFVVFWRLTSNRIDHSPSFFRVCLRRHKHQQDLREMPTDRVHRIWPALSAAQRRKAIEFGHTDPAAPVYVPAESDLTREEIDRLIAGLK